MSANSKAVQNLLLQHTKDIETPLDDIILNYVGDLFNSWYLDGYGMMELTTSLKPILLSSGLTEAHFENFLTSLETAFQLKDRTGNAPQISAVVPIETPVQMSLAPITAQMIDEPKNVSLDWLASKKVNASQVDRSKLEKAEYKLRMKAISRNKKAMADQASEIAAAIQKQLELMSTSASKKTPVEIVDELILEQTSSASVSRQHDIIVEGFDISLAGRRILTNATMTLAYGRRYGLIGRNGIGKSTLLRHIASYQLSIPKSLSILHVEQEVVGDETLALTSVLQADVKREALLSEERRLTALLHTDLSADNSKMASERLQSVYRLLQDMDSDDAEARACAILSGLGFASSDFNRPTKEFSGGWRMRLALARALFCRPDLLLLDEPTNMLDFPAVVWLENHLKEWPSTLLVVSHDRYFLDGTVTDILHMHNEQLDAYRGDYNQFLATRAERLKNQQREYEAQALYRANLQAFVDRWRYNANRAPQAQSRLKILEKLPELKPVVVEAPVVFRFPPVEQISPPIIQIEDASFSYDPEEKDISKMLLRHIDLNVQLDTRMAIVGPNGAGKTTLLKMMIGKLQPTFGKVFMHGRLRIAYFTQHHVDQMDLNLNPIQLLQSMFPGKNEEEYRAQLGAFGISGPLGLQTIRTLSGGQKSRVVFAMLCLQNPHVMILDEPTNHLDMDSIDALINALKNFAGGVVVVSHDKKFIDLVCKEIWVCKSGLFFRFDGSIHEYAASLTDAISRHKDS